jgi:endonuclease/exonuclease/phosphatase family metal-dependent hydrolase
MLLGGHPVMRYARLLVVATLAMTTALSGGPAGGHQPQLSSDRPPGPTIRVASFNVKNVLFARNPTKDWSKRREVIIEQVRRERIDILGIQEAHPGRYLSVDYPDGPNQYLDLRNGLRKAGGDWQVTSAASYNCKNSKSWQNCSFKDRAASRSTRILYNTKKVELLDRGAILYDKQKAEDRYLAWAVFRIRQTGKKLLFTTTHLTSASEKVRLRQWRQMIREIERLRGRKPVIATGDLNVQKYHPIAAKMLPAMKQAKIPDVLNQEYRVNPSVPRARRLVNAWINSYNHGRKDVSTFSYDDQRHKIGNGIDWVFASRRLDVESWEVVVDYDPETLKVQGPLPSDHNMVKATVRLPG